MWGLCGRLSANLFSGASHHSGEKSIILSLLAFLYGSISVGENVLKNTGLFRFIGGSPGTLAAGLFGRLAGILIGDLAG